MTEPDNSLDRFTTAQAERWPEIAGELRAGYKFGHWMWFIFPQLRGLGFSQEAHYFGLADLAEARAYLAHPVLGERLMWSVTALLAHAPQRTAAQMLGEVDAMKLRSCLTLFAALATHDVFDAALAALFAGQRDDRTLALLGH
ncbi:MAG: DUF1810 family protein [Porphyrobacter sp.]|nr:DUF1810 family protein [Porphyrobacter sp.]